MRAGSLRHVVRIEHVTETQDATGAVVETWGEFKTVRAEMVPLSGREYFAAQSVNAENTVRFRIRYLEGITPKMRLIHDGTTYDIKSVVPDGKRREMVVMCEG